MNKYKVCVYAICKNESKFVNRWLDSVSEADEIYVLDTGSSDNTIELLKKRGVFVKQHIFNPFKFDEARNMSLSLVPLDADICVCCDLDEVFVKGWRKIVEQSWIEGCKQLYYRCNYLVDSNLKPLEYLYINKVHTRKDFEWIYPIHEGLHYVGKDALVSITCEQLYINHLPDLEKSRSFYIDLLEEYVKENPDDIRNIRLLAKTYLSYGKLPKALNILKKWEKKNIQTDKDECYKLLSELYLKTHDLDLALEYIEKSLNIQYNSMRLYTLFKILFEKKEYNEIINKYNDYINKCNKKIGNSEVNEQRLLYHVIKSYLCLGENEKAIEYSKQLDIADKDIELLKTEIKMLEISE